MKTHELHALKARLWDAKVHNFKIGSAAGYVADLESMAGPVSGEASRGSVDHLLALVEKALKSGDAKHVRHPEVKPKAAAVAKKPEKEEPKPVVKEAHAPVAAEPVIEAKIEEKIEAPAAPVSTEDLADDFEI